MTGSDSRFDSLWESIIDVGREPATGGYRRFAWCTADLTLREWFAGEAQRRGMTVEEDRNGNTWAWWLPDGWTGDPKRAFVTGSHLDSVPDGGAFDGPLGVVSAFHAIDVIRARGVEPAVPIGVVAFADEEGARFGVACVGSQLSTGALTVERALQLRDNDGNTLADALRKAGRRPEHVGADNALADRVGVYVELHVEQGRALEDLGRPVAVASSIWPHGRWHLTFGGEANHAGTTRLIDRRDPMLPFASAVHSARVEAGRHNCVATFGKVRVSPNGANAIASRVDAWLDARAADEATLTAVVAAIRDAAAQHARAGHVSLDFDAESITPVVAFPDAPRLRLQAALSRRFGEVPVLATAAGHDAGILSATVPTAMMFVRNPTGVSHSPDEYAEIADCRTGAEALADVMADWVCR
jgi:beta-ureidopropionase / N-carbamoyl-L-amino-acid hydrolase